MARKKLTFVKAASLAFAFIVGPQPALAQSDTKYDTLGFKKATSELVLENCTIDVTPDISLKDQLTNCQAVIPTLKAMRANFVGEGFTANFGWADDRLNWQIGNIYRNMALKIINSGAGLTQTSCGYVYTWNGYLLKMDENPREFFTRYDTMLDTAKSAMEKCKGLGHITALE